MIPIVNISQITQLFVTKTSYTYIQKVINISHIKMMTTNLVRHAHFLPLMFYEVKGFYGLKLIHNVTTDKDI